MNKHISSLHQWILFNMIFIILCTSIGFYYQNQDSILDQVSKKLKVVSDQDATLDELQKENRLFKQELSDLTSLQNVYDESHERISALHQLGNQVGVSNIRLIKPDETTESEDIISEQIHMEVQGEYNDIMRLINRIETQLERTFIHSASFSHGKKNTLECELKIVFMKSVFTG